MAVALVLAVAPVPARPDDRIKELQTAGVANQKEKVARPYHFGSQGPNDVFSNHASHTNRLVPVYVFGRKAELGAVTGKNSLYRDPAKIQALYGFLPENTVNPDAEYADQSDLYRVQRDAVARGIRHLFIVWFDGLDWPTTQAAAIVKTGKIYTAGKGSGLIFQDFTADGTAQFGYVVTSPTHDKNTPDVDAQTVVIPRDSLGGGYDVRFAGPNPWTLGPLGVKAPGYLKGQSANDADKAGVKAAGGVLHAYTDSSTSAAEVVSGRKAYNNGINATDDGTFVPTLFHELQAKGWKLGTVTSVPFDHASPAAMYAHNVDRDDFQDLARDMLGLPGITQESHKDRPHPGLDVVIGAGFGQETTAKTLAAEGKNGVKGNPYLTDADKAAIDVKNGGKYVVAETTPGRRGDELLRAAAESAAQAGQRLFGFFGTKTSRPSPVPHRRRRVRPRSQPRRQGRDLLRRRPRREPDPGRHDPRCPDRPERPPRGPLRPLRRGGRRRFRPPQEQPRHRHRRRLQRRGRDPGDHRLGQSQQQLGRVGHDRHLRPRPLPRPRRPRRAAGAQGKGGILDARQLRP